MPLSKTFADAVAVKEVGEYGPETAADEGEGENHHQNLGNAQEEFFLVEKVGASGDKDADDAVVEGDGIGQAVDGVGDETDDDGGHVSAHHGGKDCA